MTDNELLLLATGFGLGGYTMLAIHLAAQWRSARQAARQAAAAVERTRRAAPVTAPPDRDALRAALEQFIDPDDDTMPSINRRGHGFTWVPTEPVIDNLCAAITNPETFVARRMDRA